MDHICCLVVPRLFCCLLFISLLGTVCADEEKALSSPEEGGHQSDNGYTDEDNMFLDQQRMADFAMGLAIGAVLVLMTLGIGMTCNVLCRRRRRCHLSGRGFTYTEQEKEFLQRLKENAKYEARMMKAKEEANSISCWWLQPNDNEKAKQESDEEPLIIPEGTTLSRKGRASGEKTPKAHWPCSLLCKWRTGQGSAQTEENYDPARCGDPNVPSLDHVESSPPWKRGTPLGDVMDNPPARAFICPVSSSPFWASDRDQ